jgi:hypothetical protein
MIILQPISPLPILPGGSGRIRITSLDGTFNQVRTNQVGPEGFEPSTKRNRANFQLGYTLLSCLTNNYIYLIIKQIIPMYKSLYQV